MDFSIDKGINRVNFDGRKTPLKARLELNHSGDELHEAKRRELNLAMKRGFTSSTKPLGWQQGFDPATATTVK
ncbi:MAG TPA: hypothetical protein VG347_04880 [Verrucomicrobiae bacterium]|nr:hypothetical protein [Verrucomicrobiae bacterium]